MVPAESEIVIEGYIDTEFCEPEAPFGESHGHIALEEFNMPMTVTAITHRRRPIVLSYLSQVTPSESSVMKRVSYEPMFFSHLTKDLGVRGLLKVSMHEPLTNLRKLVILVFEKGASRTEIWRGLYGAANFKADVGKICLAVSADIDPKNADALWWALAYCSNPIEDVQILGHRSLGHGPKREGAGKEDSTLLINACAKQELPPFALPKQEYMEKAVELWASLGLPPLSLQPPWFGEATGDWLQAWDDAALRAVLGDYFENGKRSYAERRQGVKPETKFRPE
jgi:4-hydroxy-3-polyprenylbenzoate decarboxylase